MCYAKLWNMTYLPEFSCPRTGGAEVSQAGKDWREGRARVRSLGSHCAGLPAFRPFF